MVKSPYDIFAKEYETNFPAHGTIQASSLKTKTPYQLDLEVKDRKPSIVPKVGDRVKIKSREWYEKWKDEDDDVMIAHLPKFFAKGMSIYCGLTMTIKEEQRYGFLVENCKEDWVWLPEFFEEVYPVQEQLSSKFPKIDLSGAIQPLPNCLGGELVLSKEEQERLKEQLRTKWGIKPKLKQIKTTHLIKLKKL
jgi:hypothetical protein